MNALPHMRFTEPKVVDSKDVAIETKVEGVTLKVFLRRKGIQVELRHRTVAEEETIRNHFKRLGATIRKDGVFLPNAWKREGISRDISEVLERIQLLIQIIKTDNLDSLSIEAKNLLRI